MALINMSYQLLIEPAKIWLKPISLARCAGFAAQELNKLLGLVEEWPSAWPCWCKSTIEWLIFSHQNGDMHSRHIAPLLTDALTDTPVVLLNGARQSGKSTLVQSLPSPTGVARQYLTLDDAVVLSAAKSDPAGFINGLQGAVTLDEVQRVPELFLAIKAAVDRQREPGRFL
jgi:predicted AAA+ superfamily ATPase